MLDVKLNCPIAIKIIKSCNHQWLILIEKDSNIISYMLKISSIPVNIEKERIKFNNKVNTVFRKI